MDSKTSLLSQILFININHTMVDQTKNKSQFTKTLIFMTVDAVAMYLIVQILTMLYSMIDPPNLKAIHDIFKNDNYALKWYIAFILPPIIILSCLYLTKVNEIYFKIIESETVKYYKRKIFKL